MSRRPVLAGVVCLLAFAVPGYATSKEATHSAACATAPTISGTPYVGNRLTSSTPPASSRATYSYRWKAGGASIPDAGKARWTVRNTLFGQRITVSVRVNDGGRTCTSPASSPTAPVSHDPVRTFGVALSGNSILYPDRNDFAIQDRRLAQVRQLGARWIRFDLNWEQVQHGGPQRFNWTVFDRLALKARKAGLSMLLTILQTPPWANGGRGNFVPPSDPGSIAPFCAKAALHFARLGAKVAFEVWNEPNIASMWRPAPDAAAYTRLLRACHDAIKKTGLSTFVVSGGLSPVGGYDTGNGTRDVNQVRFLEQMFAAGAAGSFDALGYHPYAFPASAASTDPNAAWPQMAAVPHHNIRQVMADNHYVTPIWATEFGMPSAGQRGSEVYTEDWQRQDIERAASLWRTYPWAGKFFYYSLVDGQDGGSPDSFFRHFGLVRADYSHKPAFDAYRSAITSG